MESWLWTGTIAAVPGALPAAVMANSHDFGLICPEPNGAEAAWAGDLPLLAPQTLVQIMNHFKGTQVLSRPEPGEMLEPESGRRSARRSRAGNRETRARSGSRRGVITSLWLGPPGSGKSMLAARLPGL